jgi:hypothetical protein
MISSGGLRRYRPGCTDTMCQQLLGSDRRPEAELLKRYSGDVCVREVVALVKNRLPE